LNLPLAAGGTRLQGFPDTRELNLTEQKLEGQVAVVTERAKSENWLASQFPRSRYSVPQGPKTLQRSSHSFHRQPIVPSLAKP